MTNGISPTTVFLAAYDPAVESHSGNYWAWAHSTISRNLLDKLYYDFIAGRRPEDPNTLGREDVVGGCASLDDKWCFWYRFFNGDRDSRGRPGRFVVVVALLRSSDLTERDWSSFLTSPVMQEMGDSATTCPMPVPPSLETTWDSPAVAATQDLLMHMNGKTAISLSAEEIGQAIGLVAGTSQFRLEVDWVRDRTRTQLTLNSPIQCLPSEPNSQRRTLNAIGQPEGNAPAVEQLSAVTKGDCVVGTDDNVRHNHAKDRLITLLTIAVVVLSVVLLIVLLPGRSQAPPVQPTVPSTPVEPVVPRVDPKRSDSQASIQEEIMTYVYYHQMLCNKDGPTDHEICDFFNLTEGQQRVSMDGLVGGHKLVRALHMYPLGPERYQLNRNHVSPAEIERLPHLVQSE